MEVFEEGAEDGVCLTALKKLQFVRLPTMDRARSTGVDPACQHFITGESFYCDIQNLEFYILNLRRSGERIILAASLPNYMVLQKHFNSVVVGLSIQLAKGNIFVLSCHCQDLSSD